MLHNKPNRRLNTPFTKEQPKSAQRNKYALKIDATKLKVTQGEKEPDKKGAQDF